MSPEQLSFIIGFIYGSALTLLLFCFSRRSRNRRDPFLDCRDHSGSQFNEGRTIRGNGNGGPTTPKPELPPCRVLSLDGSTIGYRYINYPNPSPDRPPTNPFNGERIPNPPPREP
jgi:hypothetical protein